MYAMCVTCKPLRRASSSTIPPVGGGVGGEEVQHRGESSMEREARMVQSVTDAKVVKRGREGKKDR
jgi:hypothetical protein